MAGSGRTSRGRGRGANAGIAVRAPREGRAQRNGRLWTRCDLHRTLLDALTLRRTRSEPHKSRRLRRLRLRLAPPPPFLRPSHAPSPDPLRLARLPHLLPSASPRSASLWHLLELVASGSPDGLEEVSEGLALHDPVEHVLAARRGPRDGEPQRVAGRQRAVLHLDAKGAQRLEVPLQRVGPALGASARKLLALIQHQHDLGRAKKRGREGGRGGGRESGETAGRGAARRAERGKRKT